MRHFHLTRNKYWRPVINVDKLWSLVPEEEKKGLTESSEVVPVIDTLQNGYGKILGNGKCVSRGDPSIYGLRLIPKPQPTKTTIHCEGPLRFSEG